MPLIFEGQVDSSAIASFAYDEERRELYIRYRGGKAYTYYDVPVDDYLGLVEADSKGSFVNEVIKETYEFSEGAPI